MSPPSWIAADRFGSPFLGRKRPTGGCFTDMNEASSIHRIWPATGRTGSFSVCAAIGKAGGHSVSIRKVPGPKRKTAILQRMCSACWVLSQLPFCYPKSCRQLAATLLFWSTSALRKYQTLQKVKQDRNLFGGHDTKNWHGYYLMHILYYKRDERHPPSVSLCDLGAFTSSVGCNKVCTVSFIGEHKTHVSMLLCWPIKYREHILDYCDSSVGFISSTLYHNRRCPKRWREQNVDHVERGESVRFVGV
jgi:hypothetical protein